MISNASRGRKHAEEQSKNIWWCAKEAARRPAQKRCKKAAAAGVVATAHRPEALNKFNTTRSRYLVDFTALIPYGKPDSTNPARARAVSPTDGFRQLLTSTPVVSGLIQQVVYRFVARPWLPSLCNLFVIERHTMSAQAGPHLQKPRSTRCRHDGSRTSSLLQAGGGEGEVSWKHHATHL